MQKKRHNLYFEPKLSEKLAALANKPGTNLSSVVGDALRDYFERKGADALEQRFKERLDTIGKRLNQIDRNQKVILESLALFVRYQLTVSNPLPESQAAAMQALGNQRFEAFIEEVGRRIAAGKGMGFDVTPDAKRAS